MIASLNCVSIKGIGEVKIEAFVMCQSMRHLRLVLKAGCF